MDQQEINEQEWHNENNWTGSPWIAFYFSKKDSRTWVPKKIPHFGWTLNLGKPTAVYWLIGFILFIGVVPYFFFALDQICQQGL